MRNCPDCNMPVEDQAVFCDNCGLRLSPQVAAPASTPAPAAPVPPVEAPGVAPAASPGTCSVCGSVNVPGEMFCQNCGVQLAPVVSAPPPAPVLSKPSSAPVVGAPPAPAPPAPSMQPAASVAAFVPPVMSAPAATVVACPICGFSNEVGEKYCQNCGLELPGQSAAGKQAISPPPAPVPEAAAPEPSSITPPAPSEAPSPVQHAASESMPEKPLDTAPLSEAAVQSGVAYISGKLIVRTTHAEISLPPGKTELTIGRSDPVRGVFPDVDLTTHGGDTSGVSRLHARLTIQGAQVFVEDLNSTNYTFLNRQRLQPGQRYPLKQNDEIRLGLLVLEYV
jgi:hypothetical protein